MKKILQESNLEIILDEKETILYKITNGRYTLPLGVHSFFGNNNKRFISYCVILLILQGIVTFNTIVTVEIALGASQLIILTLGFLECNWVIFKQSLLTFTIYYKTINVVISMIAYNIDYKSFAEGYSNNASPSLVKIAAIMFVLKAFLLVFIISVLDGYCLHKFVRISLIVITLLYLVIRYYILEYIYKKFESMQAIGEIFGHDFHWHTLATSCMTNTFIFLLAQCWNIIRNPSKLNIIPALIVFKRKSIEQGSINTDLDCVRISVMNGYDSDDDDLQDSIYQIYVNPNRTIFDYICNCCSAQEKSSRQIKSCLHSSQLFWVCGIYGTFYLICTRATHYAIDGNILLIMRICLQLVLLVFVLGLNVQVVKFVTSGFVFWWQILDALVWDIAIEMIDYTSDSNSWNRKYVSSKAQAWATATISCVVVLTVVMVISALQALILQDLGRSTLQYKKFILNLLVLCPIIYFLSDAVGCFLSRDDYIIDINVLHVSVKLSCSTLVIEKSVDCSIFFLSQLYTTVRTGFDGIQVTGFVQRKWYRVNCRQYRVFRNVATFDSVEGTELLNCQ